MENALPGSQIQNSFQDQCILPNEETAMDQNLHHSQSPSSTMQNSEPATMMDDMSNHKETMKSMPVLGHMMSADDPDNPLNWPIHRKVYVSLVSFAFGFAVAFGLTAYTSGIAGVIKEFGVSYTVAILPFSLYLFGIAFAPIMTPHISERFGRAIVYMISLPVFSLFILGAGLSPTFAGVAVCRFFAGFFGGPCLVLIEGTFADVWSGDKTGSYYAVLAVSSYFGAATGPLVGGFLAAAQGWRWTQWVTLMIALGAFLLGIGMHETYPREILRSRAKRNNRPPPNLAPAQSGVTLAECARTTIITPAKMLFTEVLVIGITIYLGFNFGVIFSFFISVPVVLNLTYGFTVQQAGLAFIAAMGGSVVAAVTAIIVDRAAYPRFLKKSNGGMVPIEYRLFPAMYGGAMITASLFWIAWTASPKFSYYSPILGTFLYVWGNQSVLIGFISYIFDAYPPAGTLSALTIAASFRLLCAGAISLCIIQMIVGLTGAWAYSLFGFIAAALMPLPFILYKYGPQLRARSPHGHQMMDMAMGKQSVAEVNMHSYEMQQADTKV